MNEFEELKKKLWDSIDKSSKQLAATQRVLLAVLNVEANTESPFEFIPDLCELDKCRCGDGWVAGCLCEHHKRCNGGCTFSADGSYYDPRCPEHGHKAACKHIEQTFIGALHGYPSSIDGYMDVMRCKNCLAVEFGHDGVWYQAIMA